MESTRDPTRVETSLGAAVFASEGEKIGDLEKVLYDKATRKPEWLAVQTGLFGFKSRLVPFDRAERRADGVFVPYPAARVREAPELEGDEVPQQLERRLASHYGLEYSETRSPTGLARSKTERRRTGERRSDTKGRRKTRQRTSQASRGRRTSDRPTRDELYAEAKGLGIEGRSKMNKAQLERAVSRARGRGRTTRGTEKANPVEVQKFLDAVGYPASRRELVREADERGADKRVLKTLERLPDRKFESPTAVSEAIGRLG